MRKIFFLLFFILGEICYAQEDMQEKDTTKVESLFSVVTTNEEFPLEGIKIIALPALGPYMISGNTLFSLSEESNVKTMEFPTNIKIDDIIWNTDDFVIKAGNEIYLYNSITTPRIVFNNNDFAIFPNDTNNMIYVVQPFDNFNSIYIANLKLKRVKRLLNVQDSVLIVARRGNATWVVTTNDVFKFENDECTIPFHFFEPIHSAIMTTSGLVFASDTAIRFLTNENQYITLIEGANKGIFYDGIYLYILTESYDLLQCDSMIIDLILTLLNSIPEESTDTE